MVLGPTACKQENQTCHTVMLYIEFYIYYVDYYFFPNSFEYKVLDIHKVHVV